MIMYHYQWDKQLEKFHLTSRWVWFESQIYTGWLQLMALVQTLGGGLYINKANDYQFVQNKFWLIWYFFQPLN